MLYSNCAASADEEVDFFLDLAMHECQRWLEVVCRELFIDSDDFLYSLRYGSHLRKAVNKIIPRCFDVPSERSKRPSTFAPRTTRQILQNAGIEHSPLERYIDDEDWIAQLLLICLGRFGLPASHLFRVRDLVRSEGLQGPYKDYVDQCESPSSDGVTTAECTSNDNDRIRRLCVTIAALSEHCKQADRSLRALDRSAVEPLLEYHEYVVRNAPSEGRIHPLDREAVDVASTLCTVVDEVCTIEEQQCCPRSITPSSDEGFDTMVECNYTVSKYLGDLGSEYSTEDVSSYSTGTKSSRSCSPFIGERCFSGGEQQIPTRPIVKLTSQVAHNPLQFVSAKSAATALSEQAKQQIVVSEHQKRIREDSANSVMRNEESEATSWQSNLDSWLSKRKSALTKGKVNSTPTYSPALRGEVEKDSKFDEPLRTISARYREDKEEILTITSSPPIDEHVDSGIENNRSTSNPQSPCTSLEFSPRSDSKLSSEYTGLSPSPKYFVRGTSPSLQSPPLPPPPPPPPPPVSTGPSELQLQRDCELGEEFANVETLLKIDTDRPKHGVDHRRTPNDQVVIGFSVGRPESRPLRIVEEERPDSDNEFPEPPPGVVRDAGPRVSDGVRLSVFSDQRSPAEESKLEAIKKITLGVELCREQTANVTAVKFPVKKQKTSAEHSCAEPLEQPSFTPFSKATEVSTREIEPLPPYLVPYTSGALQEIRTGRASLASSSAVSAPVSATATTRPVEQPAPVREKPTPPPVSPKRGDVLKRFEDMPAEAYYPRPSELSTRVSPSSPYEGESRGGGWQPEPQPQPRKQYGDLEPTRGGGRAEGRGGEQQPAGGVTEYEGGGVMRVTIDLGHHTKNPRKYFGITVGGGKDKNAPLKIDSIIAGSPAEESGLQVGDLILSVNGESVEDRYHQSVIRMLHEAARLGEVELRVRRPPSDSFGRRSPSLERVKRVEQMSPIVSSFDEKRSLFDQKPVERDSFYEFRQQKQHQMRIVTERTRDGIPTSPSKDKEETRSPVRQSYYSKPAEPVTKVVRNYDPTPAKSYTPPYTPPLEELPNIRLKKNDELTYIPLAKRPIMDVPPEGPTTRSTVEADEEIDDDTRPGRSFVRKQLRQQIGFADSSSTEGDSYPSPRPPSSEPQRFTKPRMIDDSQNLLENDFATNGISPRSGEADERYEVYRSEKETTYREVKSSSSAPTYRRSQSPSAIGSNYEKIDDGDDNNRRPVMEDGRTVGSNGYAKVKRNGGIGFGVFDAGSQQKVSPFGASDRVAVVYNTPSDSVDKRVTFGESQTHEITPRQTREIEFFPSSSSSLPLPLTSTHRSRSPREFLSDDDDFRATGRHPYRTVARYGFGDDDRMGVEAPTTRVERIHPIKLSGRPDPEGRILLSKTTKGAVPSTVLYEKRRTPPQRRVFHPNPSTGTHVVQVRCSSCDDLRRGNTATALRTPQILPQSRDSASVDSFRRRAANRSYDDTTTGDSDYAVVRRAGEKGADVAPYEAVTEKIYNSNVRTRRYVSRSISPQHAKLRDETAAMATTIPSTMAAGSPQYGFHEDGWRAPELVEATDSREWRQVIEEQRLPSPGDPSSRNRLDADSKFRVVHSSSGSMKDSFVNTPGKSSSLRHLPPIGITDATRMSNLNPRAEMQYTKLSPTTKVEGADHWEMCETRTTGAVPPPPKQIVIPRQPREPTPSPRPLTQQSQPTTPHMGNGHAGAVNTSSGEPVVAVSGKHKCSHCQMELGRGAAMIIESLNLFYHLSCFRCYVCNTALGNGTQGTDVRVRDSKLHCQSCYSNEEAGLKFSQV